MMAQMDAHRAPSARPSLHGPSRRAFPLGGAVYVGMTRMDSMSDAGLRAATVTETAMVRCAGN